MRYTSLFPGPDVGPDSGVQRIRRQVGNTASVRQPSRLRVVFSTPTEIASSGQGCAVPPESGRVQCQGTVQARRTPAARRADTGGRGLAGARPPSLGQETDRRIAPRVLYDHIALSASCGRIVTSRFAPRYAEEIKVAQHRSVRFRASSSIQPSSICPNMLRGDSPGVPPSFRGPNRTAVPTKATTARSGWGCWTEHTQTSVSHREPKMHP